MMSKVKVLVLVAVLLVLLALPVSAQNISCSNMAVYSDGVVKISCRISDVPENTSVGVLMRSPNNVQLYYREFHPPHGMVIPFNVSFSLKSVVSDRFEVFPDYTFSRLKIPVYISVYARNGSRIVGSHGTETALKVKFDIKRSLFTFLNVLWGLIIIVAFFTMPLNEYKHGRNFATDIVVLQVLARAFGQWWVMAPFIAPFMDYRVLTDPRMGDSLLVLGGLTALFFLQSIYALGMYRAKCPKISFYTGLEWIVGVPFVFYFMFSDYATVLFMCVLPALPLFIILWKYAELPYSKCRRALSLFRTYSVPLSIGVALALALHYTTKETLSLFGVFLLSLATYVLTSKLAFDKLEWAKRRFDEDIERLSRGLRGTLETSEG